MSEERLSELRDKIDEIDESIVDLLSQRIEVAHDILAQKKKLGKGVRDKKREQEVIERIRKIARDKDVDPEFAEDILRITISRTVGEEREEAGEPSMWSQVQAAFMGHPAQLKVARVLYKYGFRVKEEGDIVCGDIRIPAVQIAEEAGVDRRAVDSTSETILKNDDLREIFSNLRPIPFLKGVAKQLGLGLLEILPPDPTQTGIISDVTKVVSKYGVSVRQSIAEDPYFSAQPKLTIITDRPVSGDVIEELRDLPSVESVIVY